MTPGLPEIDPSKTVAIVKKELVDPKDRSHPFEREMSFVYYVYTDGKLDRRVIEEDVSVSQYDGKSLFHKGKSIRFLGVNTSDFPVQFPVNFTLSDATHLNGTAYVNLYFDLSKPDKIETLFGPGLYETRTFSQERHTRIYADVLQALIIRPVIDGVRVTMIGHDRTADSLANIYNEFYQKLDQDVGLSSKGLRLQRVSFDFDESSQERLNRLETENDVGTQEIRLETEFKTNTARIKFEGRKLIIDIAKDEYNRINGS